jgi:hypothetical protein
MVLSPVYGEQRIGSVRDAFQVIALGDYGPEEESSSKRSGVQWTLSETSDGFPAARHIPGGKGLSKGEAL